MQTISAEELRETMRSGDHPPLINVLDREHYDTTNIPGSVNIPLSSPDFEDRVREHVDGTDETVIVYCASDGCDVSERAAERLEDAGFEDVRDFQEGAKGWEAAGYQLEHLGAGQAR